MHTQEKAESLWCPMMRATCIGDKCAMWRWADPLPPAEPMIEEPQRPMVVPQSATWSPYDEKSKWGGFWSWVDCGNFMTFSPHRVRPNSRMGFCGLAGRPEVMP